jgi:uncharacterized protein
VNSKQWAMCMHLAQLIHFLPPLGLIIPIVIWQLKKEEFPDLDAHGKIIANWIISALIYIFLCIPLFFVGIGIIVIPLIYVLWIIFPIIGAIKAINGETWKYPLSIRFFK